MTKLSSQNSNRRRSTSTGAAQLEGIMKVRRQSQVTFGRRSYLRRRSSSSVGQRSIPFLSSIHNHKQVNVDEILGRKCCSQSICFTLLILFYNLLVFICSASSTTGCTSGIISPESVERVSSPDPSTCWVRSLHSTTLRGCRTPEMCGPEATRRILNGLYLSRLLAPSNTLLQLGQV